MSQLYNTRTIEVSGLRTVLREAGPTDAEEAVLFVHGNPGSSADWVQMIDKVGEFTRAIAFDLPGFGKSDKPKNFNYTLDGYADFIEALRVTLGLKRLHLVGHDFGGVLMLVWADKHPEAFASTVLINTGVLVGYRWHLMARLWRMPVIGELIQATVSRFGFRLVLSRGNPRGLPRSFIDEMYSNYDFGTRRAVLKLYRSTAMEVAGSLAERLTKLDLPALIVWGTADPYIPPEQADIQKLIFPRAEMLKLPNSGHWPFVDDGETVNPVIVDFLRSRLA